MAEVLSGLGHELHIVVTRGALEVARHEEGLSPSKFISLLEETGHVYEENDYTSPLASSSSAPHSLAVVPASMKTTALIASGTPLNLAVRAALAVLRLGRRLVVAPRETPVGIAELRNMLRLAEMGAVVVPLCVGFYTRPRSIADIVDFLAGKVLDALGIDHSLYPRWGGGARSSPQTYT